MNWIPRLTFFGLMSSAGRAWAQAPSTPALPPSLPGGTPPPVTSVPRVGGPEVVDASTGFVLVSAVILSDALMVDPMLSPLRTGKTCRLVDRISGDPAMLSHAA